MARHLAQHWVTVVLLTLNLQRASKARLRKCRTFCLEEIPQMVLYDLIKC